MAAEAEAARDARAKVDLLFISLHVTIFRITSVIRNYVTETQPL